MFDTIIFFEGSEAATLKPLTLTKPPGELRCGIRKLYEKWTAVFPEAAFGFSTREYLSKKFTLPAAGASVLHLNPSFMPNAELIDAIKALDLNSGLGQNGEWIAFRGERLPAGVTENCELKVNRITHPWDIFSQNGEAMAYDFAELTRGRKSASLSPTNTVIGDQIFVEEGVEAECAVFNTTTGPIYLDKKSVIMEGATVRGGLYLGERSQLKLGTKIYGPTTIGPDCKVGGEVNNSVIQGLSNKGHEGFLGNSVLGEWCNIGADSNNSNLKNNYSEVKVWSMEKKTFVKTGLQFSGLIMGDHSKCGINTMFNTGTVVGVSANIFGAGFPRTYIPSFSWGGAAGFTDYKINKAFETAELVMERRGIALDDIEKGILQYIYDRREE
ncbi:MAG: GlmU family protein [Cryomorphaceae bacterium]|nr:GlmU family protein [Cryomorphaceae bacterium]